MQLLHRENWPLNSQESPNFGCGCIYSEEDEITALANSFLLHAMYQPCSFLVKIRDYSDTNDFAASGKSGCPSRIHGQK